MVTYKEAQAVVDTVINSVQAGNDIVIDSQELGLAGSYIGRDVQIRDYFLGRMGENMPQLNMVLLTLIRGMGDNSNLRSLYAVAQYEAGSSEEALATLKTAHEIDPENTMVNLLGRVITAGWSVESFASMRTELHPKVVAQLTEIADEEIDGN